MHGAIRMWAVMRGLIREALENEHAEAIGAEEGTKGVSESPLMFAHIGGEWLQKRDKMRRVIRFAE